MEYPNGAAELSALPKNKLIELNLRYLRDLLDRRLAGVIPGLAPSTTYEKTLYEAFKEHRKYDLKEYGILDSEVEEAMYLLVNPLIELVEKGFADTDDNKYMVWSMRVENNLLILTGVGDYRILEWEQDHLDDKGRYKDTVSYSYKHEEEECLKVGL